MTEIIHSPNGVPIRLTEERWLHITEEHSEMAGYYFEVLECVEAPEAVYQGKAGECIALRKIEEEKFVVAVYKETSRKDGFVITAFLTKRSEQFSRRTKLWPR